MYMYIYIKNAKISVHLSFWSLQLHFRETFWRVSDLKLSKNVKAMSIVKTKLVC